MEATTHKKIRVRIAPSPTGYFHIGTARTALFNYLYAKKHGGDFIVRIEDTDKGRSEKRFEQDILESLTWMGIEYDEGPGKESNHGPYHQSLRSEHYSKGIDALLENNKGYYCFCTKEELEAQRSDSEAQGFPPKYSRRCSILSKQEAQKNIDNGLPSVIRFRTPETRVSFHDLIKGPIEFDASLIGDFVIARSRTDVLYNFAVVIDDAEMEISHVLRGEDHVSNTPKQILLQHALGFFTPVYGHIPLILGPDRSKLSKRHGAMAVLDYKKMGYLPEALVNFIALLGWNPGTEKELFSLPELIDAFDVERVNISNAIYNIQKLDWFNAQYLRKLSLSELTTLCIPYLQEAGIQPDISRTEKVIALEHERLKKLSDIVPLASFFFTLPEYDVALLAWKKSDLQSAQKYLKKIRSLCDTIPADAWDKHYIHTTLAELVEQSSTGDIYWPLRVALSGQEHSPGPEEIAEALGKEETLKRIDWALQK